MPELAIVLIAYNSHFFLKRCLESILAQTQQNFRVIFIDNASPDSTALDFMHENYADDSRFKIIRNTKNRGYSGAANQGIKVALSEEAKYISITNPDVIYEADYFEKVLGRFKKDPKIASITGKVYKYDFANDKTTSIIDTAGLFIYKNRRVIDDGQGILDEGQFDKEKEVFGVSGACPFYRAEALEDVKIMEEYFDEDFFMYKEDIDLSWRFLLYGWKNLFYPKAVAYHGRGTGVHPRFKTKDIIENRKSLSKFQKQLSFRNQHLIQTKNELWGNFWQDFFPIIIRKIAAPFYITFFEPYLWKGYFGYFKRLPRAMKKRRVIMKNKKFRERDAKVV